MTAAAYTFAPLIGRLRQARLAKGLSAAEVDRLAGWPMRTCLNYEGLDRAPSYKRLERWAAVLAVDLVPIRSIQPQEIQPIITPRVNAGDARWLEGTYPKRGAVPRPSPRSEPVGEGTLKKRDPLDGDHPDARVEPKKPDMEKI